jgi:D-3-phosphoglycerate dehydrogenase
MKILIADKFEAHGVDQLSRLADEVLVEPGLKADAFVQRVADVQPEVIIVRSTKVPRAVMSAGRSLRLIVRAGSGYDNIDVAAASEMGISVANCPGMNSVAVAELTMGLIVALDRRIPDNVIDFRAGRWNKKEYSKAAGLKGQTLGVVGAGNIGAEVIRRARAFEMNVLYYDIVPNARLDDLPHVRRVEMDELMRASDVISIHIPGNESTENLIDPRRLALMKPTALLLNTSRAGIVDEPALLRALKERKIRGAALDVFEGEPAADAPAVETPLRDAPNLYVTHHIGASTMQAQNAVADETVRIIAEYRANGKVRNCVNPRESAGR